MNGFGPKSEKDEDGILRLTSRARGMRKTGILPNLEVCDRLVRPTNLHGAFPISAGSVIDTSIGGIVQEKEGILPIQPTSPIDVPTLSIRLRKLQRIRHQLFRNMTSSCSSTSLRTESSSDEREVRIILNEAPDTSVVLAENVKNSVPPNALPIDYSNNDRINEDSSSPVKTKIMNLVRRTSSKKNIDSKERSPIFKRMFNVDSNNATPTSPKINKPIKGHVRQASDFDMNRVHEELEKLNIATDVINKLELQLDEARNAFREIQSSWSCRLETLGKKLGDCVQKSRPYYEAQIQARQIQDTAQDAVLKFERANSMHQVAKQQVALTQESLNQNPKNVDPACLEVLNHHIQRVNDAEHERIVSEDEHRRVSSDLERANIMLRALQADLKKSIKKSKPYFEARLEFTRVLEEQKALVERLEKEIRQKKVDYQTSLTNLERISDQIHADRAVLGTRGQGVGEEYPHQPPIEEPRPLPPVDKGPRPLPPVDKEPRPLPPVDKEPRPLPPLVIDDTIEDRPRSTSEPVCFEIEKETPRTNRSGTVIEPAGLHSGIVLLAQQLQQYGWLPEDRKSRAFSFPPEEAYVNDVQYKTTPMGVKPFPTPPTSPPADPTHSTNAFISARGTGSSVCLHRQDSVGGLERIVSSAPESVRSSARTRRQSVKTGGVLQNVMIRSPSDSDGSSLTSLCLDDDKLQAMLISHAKLINEIESVAHKAISLDDLGERGSASGESV